MASSLSSRASRFTVALMMAKVSGTGCAGDCWSTTANGLIALSPRRMSRGIMTPIGQLSASISACAPAWASAREQGAVLPGLPNGGAYGSTTRSTTC